MHRILIIKIFDVSRESAERFGYAFELPQVSENWTITSFSEKLILSLVFMKGNMHLRGNAHFSQVFLKGYMHLRRKFWITTSFWKLNYHEFFWKIDLSQVFLKRKMHLKSNVLLRYDQFDKQVLHFPNINSWQCPSLFFQRCISALHFLWITILHLEFDYKIMQLQASILSNSSQYCILLEVYQITIYFDILKDESQYCISLSLYGNFGSKFWDEICISDLYIFWYFQRACQYYRIALQLDRKFDNNYIKFLLEITN